MTLFNIFDSKKYSTIIFYPEEIEFISMKKINENHYQVEKYKKYFNINYNFQNKIELVEFLKKIKKENKINSKLFIYFSNEKISKIISPNLSLSGYENYSLVFNQDINSKKSLILKTKKNLNKNIFLNFLKSGKIEIFFTKEGKLCKNEILENLLDIDWKKIQDWIDFDLIYISGYFQNFFENLQEEAFEKNIKIKILNFWKNISDFQRQIPNINLKESHDFINSISIIINKTYKNKEYLKETTCSELLPKEKEEFIIDDSDKDISFIVKKKSQEKIDKDIKKENKTEKIKDKKIEIKEKNNKSKKIKKESFWKKILNLFSKTDKVKKKKEEKDIILKKHIERENQKIFLPKQKKKIFLAPPKTKLLNLQKKKTIFLHHKEKLKFLPVEEKIAKKLKRKKQIFLPKRSKTKLLPYKKVIDKKRKHIGYTPNKKILLPEPKKDLWNTIKNI